MTNENEKLLKVKKSCKAVCIVARILMIFMIIGTVAALIGGSKIWSMGSDFDAAFAQLEANGVVTTGDSFGGSSVFHLDKFDPDNIQTSVPAIREKLDTCPQSFVYSVYLFMTAGVCAVLALVMGLVIATFKAIIKNNTPFCDPAISMMTITLIVLTGIFFLTAGTGTGAILAVITWAIYTIMQYGKALQIQSDETL